MTDQAIRIETRTYRNVFIVQNRDFFTVCPFEYDKARDLVLSFDFGVVNMIRSDGGYAQYIDHIVESRILEDYNHITYNFFAAWHYNSAKQDIFAYRGIDVASAFRIEIWNDITFYVRIFANLHEVFKRIKFDKVYAGLNDRVTLDVLEFMNIKTITWTAGNVRNTPEYYFPIFKWMEDALHPTDMKSKIKSLVLGIFDFVFSLFGRIKRGIRKEKHIYIEWYHPTSRIIAELNKASTVKMVRSDFMGIKDVFNGKHLPVSIAPKRNCNDKLTRGMIAKFHNEKCAILYIDGVDISNEIYDLIIKRIAPLITVSQRSIDTISDFFSQRRLCLMVTIASIGVVNRLMINYCKKNDIPVYMIINGWLGNSFLDEAKEGGTWVNSYSESVKKHYFKGMNNVVCLGDPRMDEYSFCGSTKKEIPEKPTIGIGASGFTNVDLNCYLAIEFEFINDIMHACKTLMDSGREMDVIIKVRQNGYITQYRNFMDEYFPGLPVTIVDSVPIKQVYEKSDFFISIYSQSLFEAACFGIPVLYYKNDTQYFDPPFEGKSELVTAFTPDDLEKKIRAFYNHDKMYDAFNQRKTLEKYIGPLDGQNLKRNMDFIYGLCLN